MTSARRSGGQVAGDQRHRVVEAQRPVVVQLEADLGDVLGVEADEERPVVVLRGQLGALAPLAHAIHTVPHRPSAPS